MRISLRIVACFCVWLLGCGLQAAAQPGGTDPRPTLFQLIAAFQQGGPQPAFQWLAPAVYQMVFQQTGGTGYYASMAQLGQVTGAQVYGRQDFPVGPVYAVRVSHQYGAVDWYIGFNRTTNMIEYIASQAAPVGQPVPQVQTPPPPSTVSTPARVPTPPAVQPPPTSGSSDGCDLYPTMCK